MKCNYVSDVMRKSCKVYHSTCRCVEGNNQICWGLMRRIVDILNEEGIILRETQRSHSLMRKIYMCNRNCSPKTQAQGWCQIPQKKCQQQQ